VSHTADTIVNSSSGTSHCSTLHALRLQRFAFCFITMLLIAARPDDVHSQVPASAAVRAEADPSRISRDVIVRTPLPPLRTFVAGGRLLPGVYVGQQMYTDTKQVANEVMLWLFANGEYRQQWLNTKLEPQTGTFAYDPGTGRIDLSYGSLLYISNDPRNPDDTFAALGRNDVGLPMLMAVRAGGLRPLLTVLGRMSAIDRPSPSAEKAALAAAEIEAARYKYAVPAGQGIPDSRIAGMLSHTEITRTQSMSFQIAVSSTLSLYLLLIDGTIHNGIPVATDEMDVEASRRGEPETWGRWRQRGNTIEIAWSTNPSDWKVLDAEPRLKARVDEELRGRFSGGESSATGDNVSYSLFSVTFGAGQSFQISSREGTGSGTFTDNSTGSTVQITRDDERASTTGRTPDVSVGSTAANANRPSRNGTYRIRGWNLEARYSDGRVVRQPFFFSDSKRDAIFWQGKILTLDRDER
jgi:hypothetical protein